MTTLQWVCAWEAQGVWGHSLDQCGRLVQVSESSGCLTALIAIASTSSAPRAEHRPKTELLFSLQTLLDATK